MPLGGWRKGTEKTGLGATPSSPLLSSPEFDLGGLALRGLIFFRCSSKSLNDGCFPDGKLCAIAVRAAIWEFFTAEWCFPFFVPLCVCVSVCFGSCIITSDFQVRLDTTWDNETFQHVYR